MGHPMFCRWWWFRLFYILIWVKSSLHPLFIVADGGFDDCCIDMNIMAHPLLVVAAAWLPCRLRPVTSSLTKDMNCAEDLYRANSIRVLSRIIDATMLGAIERLVSPMIKIFMVFPRSIHGCFGCDWHWRMSAVTLLQVNSHLLWAVVFFSPPEVLPHHHH